MSIIPYLGTARELPILKKGDIIFGEAGFEKGRSVVLLDEIENCTTNAHGLYARRKDNNIERSVFFRCVFHWYRTVRLIDIMAVGGSGGHFSPEYFHYLRIPKFPQGKQDAIVKMYHNPVEAGDAPSLDDFAEWHARRNAKLGLWELDREMKDLQGKIDYAQEQIICGKKVTVQL